MYNDAFHSTLPVSAKNKIDDAKSDFPSSFKISFLLTDKNQFENLLTYPFS